jgi:hypothetical protein
MKSLAVSRAVLPLAVVPQLRTNLCLERPTTINALID